MTRINIIEPWRLSDQHLMAEYVESAMVPAALRRSLRTKTPKNILGRIPKKYTLNTGHVLFFYDKLEYLKNRYSLLQEELYLNRGFNINLERELDYSGIPDCFTNSNSSFIPDETDVALINERITQKLLKKPRWYRYKGKKVEDVNFLLDLLIKKTNERL